MKLSARPVFVLLSVCVDYHFNAAHFGKSVLLFSQPGNNEGMGGRMNRATCISEKKTRPISVRLRMSTVTGVGAVILFVVLLSLMQLRLYLNRMLLKASEFFACTTGSQDAVDLHEEGLPSQTLPLKGSLVPHRERRRRE
ncbi:hypothetical protein IRJ41_002305 [Triplophysa rosa]|uniref:Uncharacterized protein n=1 Tax=Triplophysa rosa TaxID=992332 RepID=A0A9W7TPV0_TRIRA|nr:hypothetical protein IRJ41_002305 [Triplophysa rosa]